MSLYQITVLSLFSCLITEAERYGNENEIVNFSVCDRIEQKETEQRLLG